MLDPSLQQEETQGKTKRYYPERQRRRKEQGLESFPVSQVPVDVGGDFKTLSKVSLGIQ